MKPWSKAEPGGEDSGDEAGPDLPRSLTGCQVAERCLDRQLLGLLCAAGQQGALVSELHEALALNLKRNAHRMRELERRYGVKPSTANAGRALVARYRLPPELVEQIAARGAGADGSGTPGAGAPAEDGARAAAQATKADVQRQAGQMAGAGGLVTETPASTQAHGAGDDAGCGLQARPGPPGGEAGLTPESGRPSPSALAAPSPPRPRPAQQASSEGAGEPATAAPAAGDLLSPASAATPAAAGGGSTSWPTGVAAGEAPPTGKACGELHHVRQGWLVEHVQRQGLMLLAEVGRFLAAREGAVTGAQPAAPPDRRTCLRVADRAVAAGKLDVSWKAVHSHCLARATGKRAGFVRADACVCACMWVLPPVCCFASCKGLAAPRNWPSPVGPPLPSKPSPMSPNPHPPKQMCADGVGQHPGQTRRVAEPSADRARPSRHRPRRRVCGQGCEPPRPLRAPHPIPNSAKLPGLTGGTSRGLWCAGLEREGGDG